MPGRINIIEHGHESVQADDTTITLDADQANISAGGNEQAGNVILLDGEGVERLRLSVEEVRSVRAGKISLRNNVGPRLDITNSLRFIKSGDTLLLRLNSGGLTVNDDEGNAALEVGKSIKLKNESSENTTVIEGGRLEVGGGGVNGVLKLLDEDDEVRVAVGGNSQDIRIKSNENVLQLTAAFVALSNSQGATMLIAANGDIVTGGFGQDGKLILRDREGKNRFEADGDRGGVLTLRDDVGNEKVVLNSGGLVLKGLSSTPAIKAESNGVLTVGGSGFSNGVIKLFTGVGTKPAITLDSLKGELKLGNHEAPGRIKFYRNDSDDDPESWTLHMDGEQGDIFLKNADCAEDFDVAEAEEAEPGTVMVIDAEGKLRRSRQAYDKRVAGVISGAGDCRPGIVLDKKRASEGRRPVALVGKVYCKVDADYAAVEVGDLLTTSATHGHAMKAADPLKSFGAVIGKALRPLTAGRELIPILIALQ